MNTETKHTPGPWHTEKLDLVEWIISTRGSYIAPIWKHTENNGEPCGSVASQDKTQEEIDANARLIAAAPDLLTTLIGVTLTLQRLLEKHEPDSIHSEWIGHASESIHTATGRDLSTIAKEEGMIL